EELWGTLLAPLGVEPFALRAALRSGGGSIPSLLDLAEGALGGGAIGPRSRSPFDSIQLLLPPDSAGTATAAPQRMPSPIRQAATLDDLSGAILTALEGTGLAAPGTEDVPLVDYVRARVALVAALCRADRPEDAGFLWV